VDTFLDNYAAARKPSAQLAKRQILKRHLVPRFAPRAARRDPTGGRRQARGEPAAREAEPQTVNNVTAVLSSLMRCAVRDKVIEPFDISFTIKSQDVEIVAVAAADVDKVVAAATDPRYRAAILLASDAGLRVGEIRALLWLDVNEIAREITVSRSLDRTNALTETKGWERRVIPISDRLWSALRALDHVKVHVMSRRRSDAALRYDGVRDAVLAIYKVADVRPPPKPWHSLRHTSARNSRAPACP
jgi:integrase